MDTMSADLREVVYDLVNTGQTWAGDLPADLADTSVEERLHGAVFSILVLIDGDSGAGPVRLSPADQPDLDLGGQALHELMDTPLDTPLDVLRYIDDPHARQLVERIEQVTSAVAGNPPQLALKLAVGAVCQLLADNYQLHILYRDDDGEVVGESDDLAPLLPAAFAHVWDRWGMTARGA